MTTHTEKELAERDLAAWAIQYWSREWHAAFDKSVAIGCEYGSDEWIGYMEERQQYAAHVNHACEKLGVRLSQVLNTVAFHDYNEYRRGIDRAVEQRRAARAAGIRVEF